MTRRVSAAALALFAAGCSRPVERLFAQPIDSASYSNPVVTRDMIIFGSSDLAVTFLEHSLLDECRIMVNPVVLGRGKSLFQGINDRLRLKLMRTKTFHSGNVLLYYEPVKK